MAQALAALKSARIYLNDINGVTWSDAILMPILQEAFNELVQELENNNLGTLKIQTSPINVPSGSLNLGTNQPSNILNPISMLEGNVGDNPDFFQDMYKVSFLPYRDPTSQLIFWAWLQDSIQFVGANQDRSIILRYEGTPSIPQFQTDNLSITFAERYLGPRIASIAKSISNVNSSTLEELAQKNLYKIIQSRVVNDQRPTRRKAYRSFKPTSGPMGSVLIPSIEGETMNFIYNDTITGNINGINTTFVLTKTPQPSASLQFFMNGQLLVNGIGYTLNGNVVTLIPPFIPQIDPETGVSDVLTATYRTS